MPKGKAPPSRKRYEEAHPSLTVRVPAAVKARIAELAKAEGLSVSEWVQAAAAQHEADPAEAYQRGHDGGYQEGHAAGLVEGRTKGHQEGGRAGMRAGILLDGLARKGGREYRTEVVAKNLQANAEQARIALAAAAEFGKADELRRYLKRLGRVGQ